MSPSTVNMNTNQKIPYAPLVALLLSCHSLHAKESPEVAAVVDSAATTYMSDPHSVGLSIGVLKDGRSFTFNHGSAVRGKTQRPTEQTLYPIASITKTFTGSLLALAAIEKKLSLEDDVRKHLPGDFKNLEFDGQPIRLRHLLNHRSGLPFLLPDRPELVPGYQNEPIATQQSRLAEALKTYTRADFYSDLRLVKLPAVPGKEFRYSNTAAQLAGYVLEGIYQEPFEQCVKSKLARPLGMTNTAIALNPWQRGQLATGYDGDGNVMPFPLDELQAAGALKSNVADLLKYLRWHATEADEAVKLSHQPTFTENNYAAGLNWQILNANGRRLVWQEGNLPGFTSYLLFEPELGLGLVLLTNESGPSSSQRISAMANQILKALDDRSILLP